MSTAYRFIPWVRRGLAGSIAQADTGGALPARPQFAAGLTIADVGSSGVDLSLYGPGDVIGLDPRTIVRADPKPYASDVEPNYLAAVEFDQPELPWALSPAAPNADRLRPWLVLVVLDTTGADAVALPRVEPGRPLPFVSLSAAQVAAQLPDLAQSWAWAHGQQTVSAGAPDTLPQALADAPDLAISRLICPRRLRPMTGYMACLVPAFDVGVLRGLGGPSGPTAGPAWRSDAPADLELPVYYHWEFATGPDGDFETLARRLKPYKAPPTLGTVSMDVAHALPGNALGALPPSGATLAMDGALRASEGAPATLGEVHAVLSDALATEINAPADIADASAPDATRAIAAPIYGGQHAKRVRVDSGAPVWLRDLNLDPRGRAAAGIAAEVVRQNQEEFMQACWEQVGDVLRANMLLNMAALATQALDKLHARITALPPSAMLSLIAPSLIRLPWEGLTIAAKVERTSLPDALFSAAYRRLSSARNPAVRSAAATLGAQAQVGLIDRMAPGIASVEPNTFLPDGIVSSRAFDTVTIPGDQAALVDLSSIGLDVAVTAGQLQALKDAPAIAEVGFATIGVGAAVARSGIVGEAQLAGMRGLLEQETAGPAVETSGMLSSLYMLKRSAGAAPDAAGFVMALQGVGVAPTVQPVEIDASGAMIVRASRGVGDRAIGQVGDQLRRGGAAALGRALDELPAGMVSLADAPARGRVFQIDRDERGRVAGNDVDTDPQGGRRITPRAPGGATKTFGSLSRDPVAIDRLKGAFETLAGGFRPIHPGEPATVAFDVGAAAAAAAARLDPRRNVAARVGSMISVAGQALTLAGELTVAGVTPVNDRVFCAPQIIEPAYKRLAAYDREAFMPGIGKLPLNSVALLETNPRFIEAYMIGLNHEMARELLWRRYPTDQRGTVFRFFWEWYDGQPDIGAIHQFAPAGGLGSHTKGNGSGQLVLLVRGDLLRRYPNSIIYGWPAVLKDGKRVLKQPVAAAELAPPVFHGAFEPDVTMVGFSLTREQVIAGDGYFFVIEQQPTEPRFGFDQEAPGDLPKTPDHWLDAHWIDTATAPGANLSLAGPLAGKSPDGITFGKDAAHMAAVSLQRPFRVAIHASYLTSV